MDAAWEVIRGTFYGGLELSATAKCVTARKGLEGRDAMLRTSCLQLIKANWEEDNQ
jgi:hypothetical protein